MTNITIRISGNAIDISPDGKSALPDKIRELLEPVLRYKHRQLLRGQAAYDSYGRRRPFRIETRLLYDYDKYGRMICGIGFLSRISQILKNLNYNVIIEDLNKPLRPDRFDENWDNLKTNISFRTRQEELLKSITNNSRGIISAATGFGKTFLYKAICLLYPKANIVITTKRKDLVIGIRRDLSKTIPNIGQIGGGVKKPSRVTIVTADSLHHVNPETCDILIGEEVHELAAPSFIKELVKFKDCRMYGFTATPKGRSDNADIRLESLFGQIIFELTYQEAVELGLVVPIRVIWADVRLPINPANGLVDTSRQRHGLWRNQGRNEVIAKMANLFDPDEQTLIMVTTFEHAVYLRQLLPNFTLCYAERTNDKLFNRFIKQGLLSEDEPIMTAQLRQNLRQRFESGELKKAIATDIWSTGVSFNGLGVLIRADARSSEIMDSQIPGRVCRLDDNKQEGIVIDLLDQFDSGFSTAAKKRMKNYENKGWKQEFFRDRSCLKK